MGQVTEVEVRMTGEAVEMNNEDQYEAGMKKVDVKTTKIPLQILRLGLSSKEFSHVMLEREFKAMAARCRHGLCSGRRMVDHIGKLLMSIFLL